MLVDYRPYMEQLAKGKAPQEAWKATREDIFKKARFGYWENDEFVPDPAPSGHPYRCTLDDIG